MMGKRLISFGLSGWMLWIASGLVGAGFGNAYFQRKYQKCEGRQELGIQLGMGMTGGPFYAFIAFMASGFGDYGWSLSTRAFDPEDQRCGRVHMQWMREQPRAY